MTAVIFSLLLLGVTVQLIRKRRLREEYALVWFGASLLILIFSIFGGLASTLAGIFAVSYAPTLMLVLGLLFVLVVLLSQSVTISTQADRIRDLAQDVALLEWRLRHVEDEPAGILESPNANRKSTEFTNADSPESDPATRFYVGRTSPPAQRVVVVGLDGATFDLIRPWAEAGYLPTLSRLMREGAHGDLRSTVPPMTAPAWTSFATGVNPGKHRLYDWIARDAESYTFSPTTALDCRAPMLYSLLSEAGRCICSLNVPMSYPPTPVNGLLVSGLPAPSTKQPISYPADLYREIVQAVGDYILYPDPGPAYSDSGVDAFLDRLYRSTDLRVRTFDYLRSRDNFDFAMMVINGTDTASHALWKYMDRDHPLHDPTRHAKYGHAIRDYYQHVDMHLASIVDDLDDETTLILMSDHGFGPFHKFIHVNNWLMREGLLHIKSEPRAQMKRRLHQWGFAPMNIYDALMRFGLGALKREVVRGQGQGLLKRLFLSFEDVDWRRTVAYSLGNVGQIYINVSGREPFGCVRPGEQYEQVRDDIVARLGELCDPDTGEPVIDGIYRCEEIYSGDQLEHAPDILFLPRRLEYFGFGEYEFGSHKIIEPLKRGISGTHRMNGIFLAYGAGIRADMQVDNAEIVDLAPTILGLLGEPIPAHMDGRVLKEALEVDIRPTRTSTDQSRPAPSADLGDGLTEEDRGIIADRLRDLGYVG